MRTINFSEARSNLKEVLDRVVEDADVTIITRRDADDVVVMSLSEWNSWKETEYLLASPANARHLRESIRRLDAGQKLYRELVEPAAPLAVREPKAAYRAKGKTARPSSRKRGKKRG
jgi:antitoxin YefM